MTTTTTKTACTAFGVGCGGTVTDGTCGTCGAIFTPRPRGLHDQGDHRECDPKASCAETTHDCEDFEVECATSPSPSGAMTVWSECDRCGRRWGHFATSVL